MSISERLIYLDWYVCIYGLDAGPNEKAGGGGERERTITRNSLIRSSIRCMPPMMEEYLLPASRRVMSDASQRAFTKSPAREARVIHLFPSVGCCHFPHSILVI